MLNEEIAKLILQAGSATAALLALWLYHHSVQKLLELLVKQREENEKLTQACLALADDREALKALYLKSLEVLTNYEHRKISVAGEDRHPPEDHLGT